MPISTLPILYTFRRCPYAMRARLAIAVSGIAVEYREIALRDKPQAMLAISPKGTVPVLQLTNGDVIDESLDIMLWALALNDPQQWLQGEKLLPDAAKKLIDTNDGPFKYWLDRYKYADRYPEYSAEYYRQQAGKFLLTLESLLKMQAYLLGARVSIADMAIFPFIRQFAAVDKTWFAASDFVQLRRWLDELSQSDFFAEVMVKRDCWVPAILSDQK
ncbi:MAG: glutathione S-transferase [Spongiibacteraceae bacterium]